MHIATDFRRLRSTRGEVLPSVAVQERAFGGAPDLFPLFFGD